MTTEKPVARSNTAMGTMGALAIAAVAVVAAVIWLSPSAAEQSPQVVPAATVDETPAGATSEISVLAGGCFWGVQGVFQHVIGVTSAVSGYTGGDRGTATYAQVSYDQTGHAESVKVTFDPTKITYGQILQIYFSVVHDPTELNRQGPDIGMQYRSEIFPQSLDQEKVAKAYIAQLNQARVYDAAIVTKVENGKVFYPAEDYHQDFLYDNPDYPYIVINDLPKVAALEKLFAADYRPDPVLVFPQRKPS